MYEPEKKIIDDTDTVKYFVYTFRVNSTYVCIKQFNAHL